VGSMLVEQLKKIALAGQQLAEDHGWAFGRTGAARIAPLRATCDLFGSRQVTPVSWMVGRRAGF
jgi:hypothetical protein